MVHDQEIKSSLAIMNSKIFTFNNLEKLILTNLKILESETLDKPNIDKLKFCERVENNKIYYFDEIRDSIIDIYEACNINE